MSDEENGKVFGYIHDGYTRRAYIAGRPRVYPALAFSFRPLLVVNRAVAADRILKADPKKQQELVAGVIREQLEDWNLKDHEGNDVAITTGCILRLQPELFGRLYSIVIGLEGGDARPEPEEGEPDFDRVVTLFERAETVEEADVKN